MLNGFNPLPGCRGSCEERGKYALGTSSADTPDEQQVIQHNYRQDVRPKGLAQRENEQV